MTERLHDAPLRGANYMLLAMMLGAGIDVAVKALASDYGTAQIVLLRTLFAVPLVLVFCHYQGGLAALRTPRWGWQFYRGLLTAGANFGFFYALAYVPLVTALLLAYISPVLIVLLARIVLGEHIGLRRSLGCALALLGVLIVFRPDRIVWHPGMLAVLGSSVCWALLSISNRQLAGLETPAALAFYTMPVSGALAALLTLGAWAEPRPMDWLLFAMAGICGGAAHFFVALAYRYARASTVAPLEYTNLIWAAAAAYLIWGEFPGPGGLLGGAAIIIGGYIGVRAKA